MRLAYLANLVFLSLYGRLMETNLVHKLKTGKGTKCKGERRNKGENTELTKVKQRKEKEGK